MVIGDSDGWVECVEDYDLNCREESEIPLFGREYTRDADVEKRTEETRDWKDHEAVDTRVSARW